MKNSITITCAGDDSSELILVLSKEWFFWKWEKVEDVNNIYERFSEWMDKAEIINKTWCEL